MRGSPSTTLFRLKQLPPSRTRASALRAAGQRRSAAPRRSSRRRASSVGALGDPVVEGEDGELLGAVGEGAGLIERGRILGDRARQPQPLQRRRRDRAGDRDQQQHREQGGAALPLGHRPHRPPPTRKSWRTWPCASLVGDQLDRARQLRRIGRVPDVAPAALAVAVAQPHAGAPRRAAACVTARAAPSTWAKASRSQPALGQPVFDPLQRAVRRSDSSSQPRRTSTMSMRLIPAEPRKAALRPPVPVAADARRRLAEIGGEQGAERAAPRRAGRAAARASPGSARSASAGPRRPRSACRRSSARSASRPA